MIAGQGKVPADKKKSPPPFNETMLPARAAE
jgi:hypothetical protein